MYLQTVKDTYADYASNYGGLLFKKQQYDSAYYYTSMAIKQFAWSKTDCNERYFQAKEMVSPANMVMEEMKEAFILEKYTLKMKDQFVRLAQKSGMNNGKQQLDELLASSDTKLKAELKSKMLSDKAPDFILNGLNGGQVALASLKGKVVLLDFWATWCGPCIASFPAMQDLVSANKDRKDVAIYFVDTWQKEADKYEEVRDFFKGKTFKMDVLMDTDDQVVKAYKVRGIPTKVIIDKNGIVRFVSIGFAGDETKAINELQAMIDMAGEVQ
jgi:thiol-disulfide isomerase/thioredoxin